MYWSKIKPISLDITLPYKDHFFIYAIAHYIRHFLIYCVISKQAKTPFWQASNPCLVIRHPMWKAPNLDILFHRTSGDYYHLVTMKDVFPANCKFR